MTTTVTSIQRLDARILELKQRQARQIADLKISAADIVDSISPSNIFKSALKDIGSSLDLRTRAIDTVIGIGTGFLGRKLYVGGSKNIFKKITGSAVQFLVTNLVRRKMPEIRENLLHSNSNTNGQES